MPSFSSSLRAATLALALAALAPGRAPAEPATPAAPLWVTGYYAGWYWDWYPPVAVDMTTMTHFVFARYGPGGGVAGGSPGQLVEGAGTGHDPSVENALVTKAHANGIKALAMLGGAGDGGGWVASTATPALRATFIGNVLDKCVQKDYDGVDVDWEDSLDTATQQNQLVALLTELRTAAAARPRYQPPHAPFVITFPGYVLNINIDVVPPWKVTVASLVDQYNLMSYDMRYSCCGWQTWLWSPLKGAAAATPTSIESSIQGYVDAGVPRSKLGLGLGLYGGGYGPPVTGPRQAIAGYWGGNDNVSNYRDLYEQGMLGGAGATYAFDSLAQAGYYVYSPARTYHGTTVSMLITEDLQSIAAKGAWARAGNCAGAIVWTINYGYVPSLAANPPMDAVKQAFLAATPVALQSFGVE